MSRAVVDASVLFAVLADEGAIGEAVHELRRRELHAPDLLRYEVAEVLRKAELRAVLTPRAALDSFRVLSALDVVQWDFRPFAARIWELRSNVSAYDASYVALAEHLQAPLITLDRRLARASGIRCEVVVPV